MTRILFVDDQVEVARTLSTLLPSDRYACSFSPDAEAGLEVIEAGAADLVIADLQMPPGDWGGLWLLEQLRERNSAVPVLVLSGQGRQQETIRAMRLGAVDFVTKDAAADELKEQVDRAVEARRQVLEGIGDRIMVMIEAGEGQEVEFKLTARLNSRTGKADPAMEKVIVKTVAGFLNARGGTLLVGVADDGRPVGIAQDVATLTSRPDRDGYEQFLRSLLRSGTSADLAAKVGVEFVMVQDAEVCVVTVPPAPRGTWTRTPNGTVLYVRSGNLTQPLEGDDAYRYLVSHFVE